jgi:hypothetical protein
MTTRRETAARLTHYKEGKCRRERFMLPTNAKRDSYITLQPAD